MITTGRRCSNYFRGSKLTMKLVRVACAGVSVVFTVVGLLRLSHALPLGSDLSVGILGVVSGVALSFGLYLFDLRGRISHLEKQLRELER